ncbi:MAG: PqqD family protein [Actinobacteria bacterium]|nr:PqqD family protein [Actinomycetota bacterium]
MTATTERSPRSWRGWKEQSYKRIPNMVARRIGDEFVILPVRNNVGDLACLYSLNEVRAFVWECIDVGQAMPSPVDAMCGEFEAEKSEIKRDLWDFIGEMEQIGAVSSD